MENAEGFRFFSSSLLVAFDGKTKTTNIDLSDSIDIRMIDFEHSTFNGFLNDKRYSGPDKGYLLGLNSLTRIVTDILMKF